MSKLTRSYSSKINSILKKILKEEEKKFLKEKKRLKVRLKKLKLITKAQLKN